MTQINNAFTEKEKQQLVALSWHNANLASQQSRYLSRLYEAESHDPDNKFVKSVRKFRNKREFISKAQYDTLAIILSRSKPEKKQDLISSLKEFWDILWG